MKQALEKLVLAIGVLIFRLGLADLVIRLRRTSVRVLLYHSVGPADSPFLRGVTGDLPVSVFEAHLDLIRRRYHPITLSDLGAGRIPERAVLITFDDGYRSLWTDAFEPLRSRGLCPTVFLIGRTVGNEELAWTNELAWALNSFPAEAERVVRECVQIPPSGSVPVILHQIWSDATAGEIQEILARLREAFGYDASALAREARLYLDRSEIQALRREGWDFGTHTAHHYSLAGMGAGEQEAEIGRGVALLEDVVSPFLAFAYPFGDQNARSLSAALKTGHQCIMEVGGVNPAVVDLTRVARVPCQQARGAAHLFAKMELVTPLKAWVRDWWK